MHCVAGIQDLTAAECTLRAVGFSIAFHCFQLLLPSCSRRAENAASSFPFPPPASSAALACNGQGKPKPCPPDQEEQLGGDGSVAPAVRFRVGGDVQGGERACVSPLSPLSPLQVFL